MVVRPHLRLCWVLMAFGGPAAAQSSALPQAPAVVAPTSPSLVQRIDPIVAPVQRALPAAPAAAASVVAGVRRKAAVDLVKAAGIAKAAPPAAASVAAPAAPPVGVQAVGPSSGPQPTKALRRGLARSGVLAPNVRSGLGRPPAAPLARATAAAKRIAARGKPRR